MVLPTLANCSCPALLARQKESWARGDRVLIETLLDECPLQREDESCLLDLIRVEVDMRRAAGEMITEEEYLSRFPTLAQPVRDLFATQAGPTLPMPLPARKRTPPVIPGYQDLVYLDGGSQGDVYSARHVALDRKVALKVLRHASDDADQLERFHREGRLIARLDHTNIVRVYDHAEHEGLLYISMEFLEGGSLKDRLSEGRRLVPVEAARLVQTLAEAVGYAHAQNIIHRDLKPGNVLFTGGDLPKVTDFGLAKHLSAESTELTRTRMILGSAAYMPPEQAAGLARLASAASDVYSLGAVLYHALTGRPPFLGEDWLEVLILVRTTPPTPPSHLLADLPRELERICMKCLEKEAGQRYENATALADDLRRFLSSPIPTVTTVPEVPPRADGPYDTAATLMPVDSATVTEAAPATHQPSIPGYVILSLLGEGGMGSAYLARQLSLSRTVVLKLLRRDRTAPEMQRLLRMEALAMAALNHPNIVQVYDLGEYQGLVYIAMEHLPGGSLQMRLRAAPGFQPIRAAVELIEDVARAVGFVHRQGFVHRDIKPGNILLTAPDEVERRVRRLADQIYGVPKITDFGLSMRHGTGTSPTDDSPTSSQRIAPVEFGESRLTRTGAILGTPYYMAPEQASGRASVAGPEADVYSLGTTLYHLLTGRVPFEGSDMPQILLRVMSESPTSPRVWRPEVPPGLEAICLRCLAKEPSARYCNGTDLADALREFLDEPEPQEKTPHGWWRRLFG